MAEEKELQENQELEEQVEEKEAPVTEETAQEETVEEEYTGPTVVTTTEYDFRTMKSFNMYNMTYRKHFRIVYIIMGLLAFGFGGFTCYRALSAEELQIMSLVLVGIFVLFGVYFIYQSFSFEKTIDKNIQMHFYRNPKVVKLNIKVTEKEVTLQVIGNKTGEPYPYDWAYVTEIVEVGEYFFLYVQKQPIIICKDPNKVIEGDYDTLVSIIMEKTATKPYKKIEKPLFTKPITYVHQNAEDLEEADEANAEVVENDNNEENNTSSDEGNSEE